MLKNERIIILTAIKRLIIILAAATTRILAIFFGILTCMSLISKFMIDEPIINWHIIINLLVQTILWIMVSQTLYIYHKEMIKMSAPDFIFKTLEPDEEKVFRQWAHDNWEPNKEPDSYWHPVVREEWNKISSTKTGESDNK